jgi:hypothetical protein
LGAEARRQGSARRSPIGDGPEPTETSDADLSSISVVVPSVNGWPYLRTCLEALAGQVGPRPQVVVADRVGREVRERLRKGWPGVDLVEAEPGTPIPELRARAIRACEGDVVGVVEDHVIVPPDWTERMLGAHRDGARVVGGSVENEARRGLVDRAAFLCEYSHCLEPPAEGSAQRLTGNNVTYRRDLLERFRPVVEEGGWEDRLHGALREAGVDLVCRPDIRVGHEMHYTAGEYASQRFLFSRALAAARLDGRAALVRVAFALATAALPPVLLWRIGTRALRAGRGGLFLRSLPLQLVFVVAWAAGEAAGALAGAGAAPGRVR